MSDSKLDLIMKLLAKAESTTPQEAEALTEHAERLMLKHGIERARLDARRALHGDAHEEIVRELMLFSGSYARDIRELGAGVAVALGTVRPLFGASGGDCALYLVGCASDVSQARILIASLQVQSMVAMRHWWTAERDRYPWFDDTVRRRARSGFVHGFAVGAADRIRESRAAVIEESGTGTEIMLASRRERVDDAVRAMNTRRARSRDGADPGSFLRGRSSGREANVGGRPVAP